MAGGARQWESVIATYREHWPDAWRRVSIPAVCINLTVEEAIALGRGMLQPAVGFKKIADEVELLANLTERVRAVIREKYRKTGAFIRLGSHAPTDSSSGERLGFRVLSSRKENPLRFLQDSRAIIANDLRLAVDHAYGPRLFVLPYRSLLRRGEFCGVVRDGQLVGMSQLHDDAAIKYTMTERKMLQSRLRAFFTSRLRDHAAMPDYIFDAYTVCRVRRGDKHGVSLLMNVRPYDATEKIGLLRWDSLASSRLQVNLVEPEEADA